MPESAWCSVLGRTKRCWRASPSSAACCSTLQPGTVETTGRLLIKERGLPEPEGQYEKQRLHVDELPCIGQLGEVDKRHFSRFDALVLLGQATALTCAVGSGVGGEVK